MKNVVLKTKTMQLFLCFIVSALFVLQAGSVLSSDIPAFERLDPLTLQVSKPTIVTLDHEGRIYVAETSNNHVLVFSQSGSYLRTLTGLAKPISLAVDNNGRIYVGNRDRGNVEVYDPFFNHLFNLGLGTDSQGTDEFGLPNDIDIDASGTIYVVDKDNSTIRLYNPDGTYIPTPPEVFQSGNGDGQFHHPLSLAIDTVAGELVVVDLQERLDQLTQTMIDGARIQFLEMNGIFKRGYAKFGYDIDAGELARPMHVTVDGLSRVYVTDSYLQKAMVYDSNANFLGKVDSTVSSLRTPLGIAMGKTNKLYIASFLAGQVEVYGIDDYIAMTTAPASLSFEALQGEGSDELQNAVISNTGNSTFSWAASTSESWLTLSSTQGSLAESATTTLHVGINIDGLDPGQYQGSVTITANSAASEVIDVNLTVLPNAILSVTPGSLAFASTVGMTPAGQALAIENIGGSTLYWNANVDQSWLTLNTTSGTAPFDLKVYADITSLPVGIYTGTITVTKQGDNPDMQLIPVTLTLSDSTEPPVEPPGSGIKAKDKKWTVRQVLPGTSLYGIWGSSNDNLLAVGASGSIIGYDGRDWTVMESGTSGSLYGIWGSSESDVYVVGEEGLVLHYDGSKWSPLFPVIEETLRDTWGGPDSAFYTVSRNGSVLEEFSTTTATGVGLRGVWGSSGSDVFVVGESGSILHYDGGTWTSMDSDTTQWLNGIWGSSGSDVFAVGENGAIVHFDGTVWSVMDSGTPETLQSVWGSSGSDVFAVGANGLILHYNGSSWYSVPSATTEGLNDVWGDSKSVYVVGEDGTVIFGKAKFPWMHIMLNMTMISARNAEEKDRAKKLKTLKGE